jgi:hypothetical protein
MRAIHQGKDNYKTGGIPPEHYEEDIQGNPPFEGTNLEGVTQAQETPDGAKGQESIRQRVNAIHNKKRG